MKFLSRIGFFNQKRREERLFADISGYEEIKSVLQKVIQSESPIHILLVGPALVSADKALKLNPSDYNALNTKGVSLTELGEYRQATTIFDTAISISPYGFTTYLDKAIALDDIGLHDHNIGDIKLAPQSVDKTLSINSDDKEAQSLKKTLGQLSDWNHGNGDGDGQG